MKIIDADDDAARSPEFIKHNQHQLMRLFPEVARDGVIDLEDLCEILGLENSRGEEKFGLWWPGKRAAKNIALAPSNGTLRPAKAESVDWEDTTNLVVEGDNLEALKILQKAFHGRVQMIYIDPPYNTGNDFVYPDDYADNLSTYLRYTKQADDEGRKFSTNTETSGRFHSRWLSMMYPRLSVAKNLLRPEGSIFISCDDHEVHNLRQMLNEVYGEENFVATFVWKKKAGGGDDSGHVAAEHDYILCYARNAAHCTLAPILHESPSMTAKYNRKEGGRRYYLERLDKTSLTYNASMDFEIECPDGTSMKPPQPDPANPTTIWRWGRATVTARREELVFEREKKTGAWRIYTRTWEPTGGVTPRSLLVEKTHGRNRDGTREIAELLGPKVFSNPKPVKLLRHLLDIGAKDKDAIVMDFFAGSGTLGQAAMEMNADDGGRRRFILVQLPEPLREDVVQERTGVAFCRSLNRPENLAEILKERLRRVSTKLRPRARTLSEGVLDLGFRVFKLSSSNIQTWNPDRIALQKSLQLAVDNVKAARGDDDILFEVLLKLGLDLAVPIDGRNIRGKTVHSIGGGALFVCLAAGVSREDVEALGQGIVEWHHELEPAGETTCLFRDTGFEDDVAKTNLTAILHQNGLKNVRSL